MFSIWFNFHTFGISKYIYYYYYCYQCKIGTKYKNNVNATLYYNYISLNFVCYGKTHTPMKSFSGIELRSSLNR